MRVDVYNLLIVDDEPTILKGLQQTLPWEEYGFTKIGVARNVADGFTYAVANAPHLCIVDVCIGEDKGYELINKLNDVGVKSHYIMMSGYGEFKYAIEAMRAGAKEYLLKPIETEKLKNAVEKIIVNNLGGVLCGESVGDADVDPIVNIPYSDLSPLVVKVLKLTQMDYGDKVTLKSLASQFRMNPTYLGQLFLKETRMKFTDYLMSYRLQKARELIENTNEKIVVIAEQVGYANLNYFYNHFHVYFGVSPTEMRQQKEMQE